MTRNFFYVMLIFVIIFFISCQSQNIISDTCEIRAVSVAMKYKMHSIPHRLAVGNRHVAIQVLKNNDWKFLDHKDTLYFQPVEYVSLQRYLKYLIVRYDTLEYLKMKKGE